MSEHPISSAQQPQPAHIANRCVGHLMIMLRWAQHRIMMALLKAPGVREAVICALARQLRSHEAGHHPGTLLREIEPIVPWRSQLVGRRRPKPVVDVESEVVLLE